MTSLLSLKKGQKAVVIELPEEFNAKRSLLVHGIHVGGEVELIQAYPAQQLALVAYNGRKLAIRQPDCTSIKVVIKNG